MTRDELVIDYLIKHPDAFIKEISEATRIPRSSVQRILKSHEKKVLPNGNTIKEQLLINKTKGNLNGGISSSKMTISIKDKEGKFTGSIRVSSEFDKKIIGEARYYLNHDMNMIDVAIHFNISIRTLQLHFKKLEKIDKDTYILVREKQKQRQLEGRKIISGGKESNYSIEDINRICDVILKKRFTYKEASVYFDIPKSTIFELLQKVDRERRIKLDLLALENKNMIEIIPEGNRRK